MKLPRPQPETATFCCDKNLIFSRAAFQVATCESIVWMVLFPLCFLGIHGMLTVMLLVDYRQFCVARESVVLLSSLIHANMRVLSLLFLASRRPLAPALNTVKDSSKLPPGKTQCAQMHRLSMWQRLHQNFQ